MKRCQNFTNVSTNIDIPYLVGLDVSKSGRAYPCGLRRLVTTMVAGEQEKFFNEVVSCDGEKACSRGSAPTTITTRCV